MKGHRIVYSPTELAWLEANRALAIGEYHRGFSEAFCRGDVTAAHLHALRKRRGWRTGRTGQFPKGGVPVNKGKACAPGTGGHHPNAKRSQFAKGSRSGVALRLYKPIGTERITREGYRERKVHDGLPLQSRWRTVQRIEWEAVHGPVPSGMALKCLGDKLNCDPSNWELVPRALLPLLNGGPRKSRLAYDEAPEVLKPAILAAAKLSHAVQRALAPQEREACGSGDA